MPGFLIDGHILCNVCRSIPILVTKVWRRKLDYAKNLQAKYFTDENIPIYSMCHNLSLSLSLSLSGMASAVVLVVWTSQIWLGSRRNNVSGYSLQKWTDTRLPHRQQKSLGIPPHLHYQLHPFTVKIMLNQHPVHRCSSRKDQRGQELTRGVWPALASGSHKFYSKLY